MIEMRQPVPVRRQAENNETHLLLLKPELRHSQGRNRTSRQRKGNDVTPSFLLDTSGRDISV